MIDHISPTRLQQLRALIADGREALFYWWPEWADPDPERGVRAAVLRMDRGECQLCKACHELEHPESLRRSVPAAPLTAERWD